MYVAYHCKSYKTRPRCSLELEHSHTVCIYYAELACNANVTSSNASSGASSALGAQLTVTCDDSFRSADGASFVTTCEGAIGDAVFANLLQCRATIEAMFYFTDFLVSEFSSDDFVNATVAAVQDVLDTAVLEAQESLETESFDVALDHYDVFTSDASLIQVVVVQVSFDDEAVGETFLAEVQAGFFDMYVLSGIDQFIDYATATRMNVGVISGAALVFPGFFALASILLAQML